MTNEEQEHLTRGEFHKVTLKNRYWALALALVVSLSVVMVMLILYWSSQTQAVITFHKDPIPVEKTSLNRGEVQKIFLDYCKNYDVEGVVQRFLVSDTVEVRLPTGNDISHVGCVKTEMLTELPTTDNVIVPGVYYIRYEATYSVNPLRQYVTEKFSTEKFTIEK